MSSARFSLFITAIASCLTVTSAEKLVITVKDAETGATLPARVHLKYRAGAAVAVRSLPYFRDHFASPGVADLQVPAGDYSVEVERGPEYTAASESFTVKAGETNKVSLTIDRLADMAAEGWWSGELHVHRPVADIELLMRSEDLHVAPVITWWNNQNLWKDQPMPSPLLVQFDTNRFYRVMGGEDERQGGALLYFGLDRPLPITGASREVPSPMDFVDLARRETSSVWIDVEKPFWWDAPVWIASGKIDSIGIANNHMCRSSMLENEAWGKPRDANRLAPPRGNGFWTQEIYYHVLNCGLRVPPSAGSASGVLPNPVGYNRVYVHLGKELTWDAWWKGLRAGRSFVSNGPLLRTKANGHLPGHVFKEKAGKKLNVKLEAQLSGRDPIREFEVVVNGKVARTVPLKRWNASQELGTFEFRESGWFLVRVIADNDKTFRFASTAPYHVQIGDKERISKSSARFFVDWVRERAAQIKIENLEQRASVLKHHEAAERFWSGLVSKANAE